MGETAMSSMAHVSVGLSVLPMLQGPPALHHVLTDEPKNAHPTLFNDGLQIKVCYKIVLSSSNNVVFLM